MQTVAIWFGLAILAQVASNPRYSEVTSPWQGSNPQSGAAASTNAPPPTSTAAPPPAASPLAGPPPAANGVYSGMAGGALGQGYSSANTQPAAATGTQPPLRESFPGTLPDRSVPARDLNVRAADPPPGETGLKPAAMMRAMLAAPANSRLAGEWIPLDDVVAGAASRPEQSERVEAYWDLSSSVADYFLGLREQGEIARLRQSQPRTSAALDQAEKNLAVRVGTAERAARASQLRLAGLTGRGLDRLPLPANAPHCGSYQTRHDQVFAGRSSAEANELSQLIPLRHAELQDACTAVTRSQDWFTDVATSRINSPDEFTLIRALELLALERRAFVQIARDYNRRIARYVELAAPGQVDPERLIGMLIKREPSATATRSSTPGPPFNRQSQTGPNRQPTFADETGGWVPADVADPSTARRDEAVIPAAAQTVPMEPGERSLIVPKR